jgi:hypothetical protein
VSEDLFVHPKIVQSAHFHASKARVVVCDLWLTASGLRFVDRVCCLFYVFGSLIIGGTLGWVLVFGTETVVDVLLSLLIKEHTSCIPCWVLLCALKCFLVVVPALSVLLVAS